MEYGSFGVQVIYEGGRGRATLVTVYTSGTAEIQFEVLKTRIAFVEDTRRLELVGRLAAVGLNVPRDAIAARPSVPLSVLVDGKKLDGLFSVIGWVADEIHSRPGDLLGQLEV